MDEGKTSPGPWHVAIDERPITEGGGMYVAQSDGVALAQVFGVRGAANAALIAKAPTLSAELAEAIELLDESRYDTEGTDFGDRVTAFLAKHGVK